MFKDNKCFESSEGNVWKYVFTKENAVAETVLYRYESFEKRTVICCSTMSGCPVGCTFCGTGKRFICNLTSEEIVQQIVDVIRDKKIDTDKIEKFQIMFMSMGEPMLNWDEVEKAIRELHIIYPNAQLLLSTIGVNDDDVFGRMIKLSLQIEKVGLQFSIHKSNDYDRDKLIPYKNKMPLSKIRDAGLVWWQITGRKPYLNYCIDGTNNTFEDADRLRDLFSPVVFNFTFSVVCSADETMKEKGYKELDAINDFANSFLEAGYNTRVFDPSGQDDIGGGCGQLWYVQQWIRDNVKN
jgi:23S rRNA (adenine2503-C2)-methyltransferase